MKKKFLAKVVEIIKKNNPTVTDENMEVILYGIEAIYLTITKLVVIFLIAFVLGIIKEILLIFIFFNLIRINAFGIHATKSSYCLITSSLLFFGGVALASILNLSLITKIIISIICIIFLFKYAPADTEKRPIINKKKRIRFKILSTATGIIYLVLIIIFNNYIISHYMLVGMVEAVLMIHPAVYKVFKLPYDNYKNYNYGV